MPISYEKEKQRVEKRMNYAPFFKSLFTTFGVTLLAFMALLFVMFLVMWFNG